MSNIDFIQTIKELTQGLVEGFDYKLKHATYDKTFKAEITGKVSADKYKIFYKGNYHTAKSRAVYQSGDIVRVCAPENNWSDLYIQFPDCTKEYAELLTKYNQLDSRISSLSSTSLTYVNGQISTLKEFVEKTAINPAYMGMARIKDMGGWTPAGVNTWVRIIYVYQNTYNNGQYSVEGTYLLTWGETMRIGFVSGYGGTYSVTWKNISTS